MQKFIKIALLGLGLCMQYNGYGQSSENARTSLHDLWTQVIKNYPGIAEQDAHLNAAHFHQKAVRGNRLPQINAQAQNTYGTYQGTMGAFFPQSGLFNVSGTQDNLPGAKMTPNTYGSATIQWELFSFGKRKNQIQSAKEGVEKAEQNKEAYFLSLKEELSNRYINFLYQSALLSWSSRNVLRLKNIKTITAGLAASGLKPEADSLLASSSYKQSLGDQKRLSGQNEAAQIRLQELTGGSQLTQTSPESHFLNPGIFPDQMTEIQTGHPLLQSLAKGRSALELQSIAEWKSGLPSIGLIGGYTFRGTGIAAGDKVSAEWQNGFSNSANNFLVGLGITWNLTGLHTKKRSAQSLRNQAEAIGKQYDRLQLSMQSDLSSTRTKITHQYQEVEQTQQAMNEAEDAYGMYLARYQSGLIDLSTLLQIQLLLQQAEHNHIRAAHDYWLLLAHQAELTGDFDYLFNQL